MTRILFIDDDPSFAEEMKFLLQENGVEVVTANDGGQNPYRVSLPVFIIKYFFNFAPPLAP